MEADFLYRNQNDLGWLDKLVSSQEIKVIEIDGHSVSRVGAKSDALQIFIKTVCCSTLNKVKEGSYLLFLRIKLIDDSGAFGGEDMIRVDCYPHNCEFDRILKNNDERYECFNHSMSLNRNECCSLCTIHVQTARKNYRMLLSEINSKNDKNKKKQKTKRTLNLAEVPISPTKRQKPPGKSIVV